MITEIKIDMVVYALYYLFYRLHRNAEFLQAITLGKTVAEAHKKGDGSCEKRSSDWRGINTLHKKRNESNMFGEPQGSVLLAIRTIYDCTSGDRKIEPRSLGNISAKASVQLRGC